MAFDTGILPQIRKLCNGLELVLITVFADENGNDKVRVQKKIA